MITTLRIRTVGFVEKPSAAGWVSVMSRSVLPKLNKGYWHSDILTRNDRKYLL